MFHFDSFVFITAYSTKAVLYEYCNKFAQFALSLLDIRYYKKVYIHTLYIHKYKNYTQ